jgi:transposase
MVEYFGGSTEPWIPDNLRSGVSWADRYEPEVNRTYQELARHYGAAVVPARVRKPKDKAKVEVTVLLVERWILARLRNRVFFSLAELNQAIRELMEELNARLMNKLGVSRRELYEKVDRSRLQPAPANRYEMSEWKVCRVNIDYHVEPEGNYYSVPYQLAGERVEVRLTSSVVEVYYRGRRVGSHQRLYGRGLFQTLTEHMPPAHREYLEWTPSRLVSWAEKTGPATAAFIGQLLERRPHPEQGYRSCLGILHLGKRHEPERLEAACARAAQLGSYNYRTVKNILAAGLDRLPLEPSWGEVGLGEHENIRGASYYQEEEVLC